MGHHRAGEGAADEAHGGGALAGLVGVEFDGVVLGDAAALSFEPTDALPDLVESFLGAGLGEPFGELGERVLEAFGEALDDTALLGGALLGEAVQAHLLVVLGQHLVQMHAVTRCGLDAHRRLGVEVAGAFPTLLHLVGASYRRRRYDPERDRLFGVGDLVNRGPYSVPTACVSQGHGTAEPVNDFETLAIAIY